MVIFDNSRSTDRLPEDWKGESIVSTFEKGVTGGTKSPRVVFLALISGIKLQQIFKVFVNTWKVIRKEVSNHHRFAKNKLSQTSNFLL